MSLIIDRGLSSMARAEVGEYKEKKCRLLLVMFLSIRDGRGGGEGKANWVGVR